MPEEAATAPQQVPETTKTPEVPRERQASEAQNLALTALNRRVNEVKKEQAISETDKGKLAIFSLSRLGELPAGSYINDERPDGHLLTKNPFKMIKMMLEGELKTIVSIQSGDANFFTCLVRSADESMIKPYTIPHGDVVNAQLLSEADIILPQFSPAERRVVALYVDSLKGRLLGEDIDPFSDTQAVDEAIKKAAEASSTPTIEDVKAFVELEITRRQTPKIEDGQVMQEPLLTKEQADTLQQELFTMLEGKNLADFDTLTEILDRFGGYGGGAINPAGALAWYFRAMELGEVSIHEANRIRQEFRDGDMQRVLEAIQGTFAFKEESKAGKPKVIWIEDEVINAQIQEVEREIAESENDPEKKREVPALNRLLVNLLAGKEGQGEAGAFVKNATAMRALLNVKGLGEVEGLEEAMKSVVGKLDKAAKAVEDYLTVSEKLTPQELVHFKQLVQGGAGVSAVEELFTKGKLKEDKNLMKLFFGREMSQEELLALVAGTELTEEQKKLVSQGTMGILLMFLIMGLNAAFKDLTGQR